MKLMLYHNETVLSICSMLKYNHFYFLFVSVSIVQLCLWAHETKFDLMSCSDPNKHTLWTHHCTQTCKSVTQETSHASWPQTKCVQHTSCSVCVCNSTIDLQQKTLLTMATGTEPDYQTFKESLKCTHTDTHTHKCCEDWTKCPYNIVFCRQTNSA